MKNNQAASRAGDVEARIRGHEAFDRLWRRHGWNRNAAYRWLAMRLGLPVERCHFSLFDAARCEEVIALVQRELPNLRVTRAAMRSGTNPRGRNARRPAPRPRAEPPEIPGPAPRSLDDARRLDED